MRIFAGLIVLAVFMGGALMWRHTRPHSTEPAAVQPPTESARVTAYNAALSAMAVGKYDEARQIWEQMIADDPTDPVPYGNLAKLYHYTLHEYPKAEQYYLEFMTVASTSLTPYLELSELYASSYKTDTSAAVNILMAAARHFPHSPDPYVFLGEYYRDRGDRAHARMMFEQALAIVRASGNLDRMQAIGAELRTVE